MGSLFTGDGKFINQQGESQKGIILAKGALADLDNFENFIDDIYQAREKTFERKVEM